MVLASPADDEWTTKAGVSPERIAIWKSRQAEEGKRRDVVLEKRLLYFSDLPDLRKIIERKWDQFKPALDERLAFSVDMDRLEAIRVALAHGRELLPHEDGDVRGISGRIRNAVTIYRTQASTGEKRYFPGIEAAHDSLGNSHSEEGLKEVKADVILRPGDRVTFVVRALDPDGLPFITGWRRKRDMFSPTTPFEDTFEWEVTEADIGAFSGVFIELLSSRSYHRYATNDDFVEFRYVVLPPE